MKLFFDQKTGLLDRQLRYSRTAVGTNPIQIDYADYRDVNGIKRPFRWVVTWTNGQSTYQVNEYQSNVEIDNGKFAEARPGRADSGKSRDALGRKHMKSQRLHLVSAALLSIALPAVAHHGTGASYDLSHPVTLQGTVTEFHYANPHPQLFFDVTDDKGSCRPLER